MALLLQPEQPSQKELQQVREVSSSLLEAQLTSFLQEPCAVVTPQQVDTIVKETAQKTAIFYPVILPDRLEVIVKLPETETLYHYRHDISRDQFLQQLNQFQIALEEEYTFEAVENLSKQFYDWLVRPAEAQLAANHVNTLIFTLDRRLQTIPMAALHDGTQYLIEKYAVAEILGLRFGSVRSLQPDELKIMAAGLSFIPAQLSEQIQEIFQPLDNVGQELTTIEALRNFGIGVVTLKDQDFTLTNFNTRLNEAKFPVIHLATHGQFSVDPRKTFLLTAQSSSGNSLIDVDELAALFRVRGQIRLDAIDLLILNACETAAGDDLATLGLAGAAVRAGAQSAIASLWTLDDTPSVDFTKHLYENLRKPNVSKAEALRQTQLALMQNPQYKHPRYWSPYILTGNWLPLTTSRAEGSADFR
jgi:CHAT domain-containing protein